MSCSFEGCDRELYCKEVCSAHYAQKRKGGPLRPLKVKGRKWHDPAGYVYICVPGHANAITRSGTIFEHRHIMSEMLGRPLLPGENVHHKNGVRDDNRPENLELWVTSQPKGQSPEDLLEWADEIIRRYRS